MPLTRIDKSRDRRPQGFATNFIKGNDWFLTVPCGGRGAGSASCANPYAGDFFWWAIKVSPYSTYNRHLVIQNLQFGLWFDGGPDGVQCSSTYGAASGYVLYLSYTKPVTKVPPNPTFSMNIGAGVVGPTSYRFDSGKILPQPVNSNYDGNIYVTLSLPQKNMITSYGTLQSGYVLPTSAANTVAMITTNLDYDSRI